MAHALNSGKKGLRLKTSFVVKTRLMWFKLNTDSLSFAINRFVSIASHAQELSLWLFSMPLRARCKEWIARGYLQKYLRKIGGKNTLLQEGFPSAALPLTVAMKIAAAIVSSVKQNIRYVSVANERDQLSQAQWAQQKWRNFILHITSGRLDHRW